MCIRDRIQIESQQFEQEEVVSISSEDDFEGISVRSSDTDSSCEMIAASWYAERPLQRNALLPAGRGAPVFPD
eukprot:3393438-Karenia_brevis.AAC.1